MSHKARAIFLFLTIVSVLAISAVGTTNVYADDGVPPPTETEETIPPAGEEQPPVTELEEPAVTEPEEGAPAEEAGEAAPSEEVPATEEQLPAEDETEAATILEQVPDDTTVTVLNSEGEPQSLTTAASAAAIIEGDPIWCPANVIIPTPGTNGCTTPKADFTELLSFLKANEADPAYQRAGAIFVEMGDYAGAEASIDFNTYGFQYINNYNLTVKGGWNTADNSTTDTTNFNIPIVIGTSTNPWVGSLTINNINIDGVANRAGLTLFSEKAVRLFDVQVTNSLAGADLNAGGNVGIQNSEFRNNKKFGAKINAGGIVDIRNSEFSNNASKYYDSFGLEIDSQNEVSLDGVTANKNEAFGADINAAGTVAVTGSFFNGNISYSNTCSSQTMTGGYGLKVVSQSLVYLDEGVEANGNYLYGAHLEAGADGAYVYSSSFNGKETNSTSRTQKQGLELVSAGTVEVVGVHADGNLLGGANIQASDEVLIASSFFDGNKSSKCSCNGTTYYGYGLQVVTSGNLNVDDVSASGNNLVGAHLEAARVAIALGTFDDNGSGSSSNLTGKGLEIVSSRNVVMSDVTASNNQVFGANIVVQPSDPSHPVAGLVVINNSFFNGQKVYTSSCQGKKLVGGGYGLQIVTTGSIQLADVDASNNYLYGARFVSDGVRISATGDGYSSFNDNKEGLIIESIGEVLFNRVEASKNQLFGATVTVTGATPGIGDYVGIDDSVFNGNMSYTSSSCKGKTFYGYGLKVVTTGEINLNLVTAEKNYLYGAHLEGTNVGVSSSSFSFNGTGVISDHVGKGLEIISTGSSSLVNLSNVTSSNNQLFGANVTADGLVLVSNSVFSGNKSYTSTCSCKTYDGYGLQVITDGGIRLSGVTANENYLFGAHLEGKGVSVSGSVFNLNGSPIQKDKTPTGRGLEIIDSGNTSIFNVTASENQLFGANIQSAGEVTVLASTFANNKYVICTVCGTKVGGYGLKVVATGAVTLGSADDDTAGIQAYKNGVEGTIIEGKSTVNVYDSSFKDNGSTGLSITTGEDVILDNVTATGNGSNGVYVKGDCTNTVFAFGGNFAYNKGYGIRIVDAAYTPDGAQVFAGNSSGTAYRTGCTTSGGGSGCGCGGCGSSGGYSGWGWWPWYYGGYYRH